jgi:hypothetical protein
MKAQPKSKKKRETSATRWNTKIVREFNSWSEFIRRNLNQICTRHHLQIPKEWLTNAAWNALDSGCFRLSTRKERDERVMEACGIAIEIYGDWQVRALERAQLEIPRCNVPEAEREKVIKHALHVAVSERWVVLEVAGLGLDAFADVLWPAIKSKAATHLGVECEIDDRRYRQWRSA